MAVKKSTSKMKRKSGNGKSAAKSAAKKTTSLKMPSVKDPLSKSGMIKTITDVTCLSKKDLCRS